MEKGGKMRENERKWEKRGKDSEVSLKPHFSQLDLPWPWMYYKWQNSIERSLLYFFRLWSTQSSCGNNEFSYPIKTIPSAHESFPLFFFLREKINIKPRILLSLGSWDRFSCWRHMHEPNLALRDTNESL